MASETIARALNRRKATKELLQNLERRMKESAQYQEGEKPAEDVQALRSQLDGALEEWQEVVTTVTLANVQTRVEGQTLLHWLTEREKLLLKQKILRGVVQAARGANTPRYGRAEIKTLTPYDIAALEDEAAALAKRAREIDDLIQAANHLHSVFENA